MSNTGRSPIKASNRLQAAAVGGAAVIGLFYYQWRGQQVHQASKEDSSDPARLPTWEHRISQAQTPGSTVDHPATLRSNNWEPKK